MTAIAAFVTAIAALIAPIITARINNEKEIQLKRIDMFETRKINLYTDFCIAYGAVRRPGSGVSPRSNNTFEQIQGFESAAYAAALSCENEPTRESIYKLVQLIDTQWHTSAQSEELFQACLKGLSDEIKGYSGEGHCLPRDKSRKCTSRRSGRTSVGGDNAEN